MKKYAVALMIMFIMLFSMAGCGSDKGPAVSESSDVEVSESGEIAYNLEDFASESGLKNIKSFSAETIDGGSFSRADLAGYDVTMINIWSTTCPPCIQEMPSIAKLEKKVPENVKIVTWCLDGNYERQEALSILGEAGYEGTTIIAQGEGDLNDLYGLIEYTPTTIFFDSTGNIVAEPIIGTYGEPEKEYAKGINSALENIGKEKAF